MSIRMLRVYIALSIFLCARTSVAQATASAVSMPDKVTIGENTYFDFGPPFDFYEIYIIETEVGGTAVERITVTPPGDACLQPAKVETGTAILPQSLPQLLGNKSPCSIPEKALHREAKRCKHCLNFSGAKITMQVTCNGKDRLIPFHVLESDWFDKQANTPQHTSQTLQILSSINSVLGSNVMDRPIFATGEPTPQAPAQMSSHLSELESGGFDLLFQGSSERVSDYFKESQISHEPPSVTLAAYSELAPLQAQFPAYPPIARVAHIQGDVGLMLEVKEDGSVGEATAGSGPEMLKAGAIASAKSWKFPKGEISRTIHDTIEYRLNCLNVIHTSNSR